MRWLAAHTNVTVGYNVQVAVDTKHKLIVEHQCSAVSGRDRNPEHGSSEKGRSTPCPGLDPARRQTPN